jgi:hypothetical protein
VYSPCWASARSGTGLCEIPYASVGAVTLGLVIPSVWVVVPAGAGGAAVGLVEVDIMGCTVDAL